MSAIFAIGAAVAWVLFGGTDDRPTGYVGRDGKYDVYCGYKPDGHGSVDYTCERSLADTDTLPEEK